MKVCRDTIGFASDECANLCTIFSKYVPAVLEVTGGIDEHAALRGLWKKAGAINIASLSAKMLSTIYDDEQTLREHLAGPVELELAGPYIEEVLDVVMGHADLAYTSRRQYLETAFLWAATNFVQGSVVMQNTVGGTLNSSFEDHFVSVAVGSTNAGLAESRVSSLLAAGAQASAWLVQLESVN